MKRAITDIMACGRPLTVLAATAALMLTLWSQPAQATMFDPCADVVAAARGDAFPMGLALLPGANASQVLLALQNDTVSGLGKLCDVTYQNTLLAQYPGSRIAVFNLKLDRMHVLRLPYPDIIFTIAENNVTKLVVVAFRKNVYSNPAYLFNASNDTSIHGAGFVVSLALLLNFDKGIIRHLQWYDLTCNDCGGKTSQICIQQVGVSSCATPFTNCTCPAGSNTTTCKYTDKAFDKCSTAINTGFLGTDRNDEAFRTGPQIQRLNAYSLVSLFYTAKDAVVSKYDAIYQDLSGQWSAASNDAKSQQVDFGGGIGRQSSSLTSQTSPPPPPPAPPPAPFPPPPPPFPPGFVAPGGR